MCLREQMQFCVMAFVAMTLFPMLFISGCDSFVFITLTNLNYFAIKYEVTDNHYREVKSNIN